MCYLFHSVPLSLCCLLAFLLRSVLDALFRFAWKAAVEEAMESYLGNDRFFKGKEPTIFKLVFSMMHWLNGLVEKYKA